LENLLVESRFSFLAQAPVKIHWRAEGPMSYAFRDAVTEKPTAPDDGKERHAR